MANVLIVDDHDAVLEGLESHFGLRTDLNIVQTAKSKQAVMDLLWRKEIDLIILDIELGDADGKEVAEPIRKQYPHIKILIYSMHVKWKHMEDLEKVGIDGYVHKGESFSVLSEAIEAILDGSSPYFSPGFLKKKEEMASRSGVNGKAFKLSPQEQQTLVGLSKGMSVPEISVKMKVMESTVNTYKKRLLQKTRCENVPELVTFAINEGYI